VPVLDPRSCRLEESKRVREGWRDGGMEWEREEGLFFPLPCVIPVCCHFLCLCVSHSITPSTPDSHHHLWCLGQTTPMLVSQPLDLTSQIPHPCHCQSSLHHAQAPRHPDTHHISYSTRTRVSTRLQCSCLTRDIQEK